MNGKDMLRAFAYCPKCGSHNFKANDERSKRCGDCGFVYYLNSSAAVAAVIVNGRGELLAAVRAEEPARGTLDLPGGFVNPGESLEEGLAREIYEETGCEPESMKYLFSLPNEYVFSGVVVPTTDNIFLCRLKDEENLCAGDDAASLLWIPHCELRAERFGLKSISKAVAMLLEKGIIAAGYGQLP